MTVDLKANEEKLKQTTESARTIFFRTLMRRGGMSWKEADDLWEVAFGCGKMTEMQASMESVDRLGKSIIAGIKEGL